MRGGALCFTAFIFRPPGWENERRKVARSDNVQYCKM
jgi:hypothetical protein